MEGKKNNFFASYKFSKSKLKEEIKQKAHLEQIASMKEARPVVPQETLDCKPPSPSFPPHKSPSSEPHTPLASPMRSPGTVLDEKIAYFESKLVELESTPSCADPSSPPINPSPSADDPSTDPSPSVTENFSPNQDAAMDSEEKKNSKNVQMEMNLNSNSTELKHSFTTVKQSETPSNSSPSSITKEDELKVERANKGVFPKLIFKGMKLLFIKDGNECYNELKSKITSLGGEVCDGNDGDDDDDDNSFDYFENFPYVLVPNSEKIVNVLVKIKSKNQNMRGIFASYKWIEDCIALNYLLPIFPYVLN